MAGLLFTGCLETGSNTSANQSAQNTRDQNEDPSRPPRNGDPDQPPPGYEIPEACFDLREQIGVCYENSSENDCIAEIEAQRACHEQVIDACRTFEDAFHACLQLADPTGARSGQECEAEAEALNTCYENVVWPDCTAEDEAVHACFGHCDQLVEHFHAVCEPPPPPPPGPGSYCQHLFEALFLCEQEHGAGGRLDPNGVVTNEPQPDGTISNGACAPIQDAIGALCSEPPPEPCPDGSEPGPAGPNEPDPQDPNGQDPNGGR